MFRSLLRADTAAPDRTQHLLRRALFFGAGLVLLWALLFLLPARPPAEAAEPNVATASASEGVTAYTRPEETSLFSGGTLAVVVLLLGGIGVALVLRRRSQEGASASLSLQTVGQMTLAPNQQLRLVRCGDDVLLLGVTSGQINLLKSYPFSEIAEAISDPTPEVVSIPAPDRPVSPSVISEAYFARLLRQRVGSTVPTQTT